MSNKRTRGLARLFFGRAPDDQIHRAYGVRVALFFVLVLTMVAALFLIYQFTQTLYQLYLAESERDRLQRPDDGDELNYRSSTPTFGSTTNLQHFHQTGTQPGRTAMCWSHHPQ